jgi:hypothetical protein
MRRARTYRWTRMRPYRARFRGQGVFFAFQSWAGCITNIFGFDLRQAQADISAYDRGDVHEHIRAAVIGLNESIALCPVEPPHRSSRHLVVSHIRQDLKTISCRFGRQANPAGVSVAGPEYGLVPIFLPNIRELTRF